MAQDMETSANRSERSAEAGHEQPATRSRVARQLKGQAYDEQMATLAPPLPQGEEQAMASASTEQQQTPEAKRKLAESLCEVGGTAGAGDKAVVVIEMLKLPEAGLQILEGQGTKVVVCKDSITEVRTDLKGVKPRGWPPGSTWDSVPGIYDTKGNRVIIATRNGKVPPKGDGHGSANLVLHEIAHAIDKDGRSETPEFVAARDEDKDELPAYLLQDGKAGRQETYAESAAWYYGGDQAMMEAHPNLAKYWEGDPLSKK